ncbi:MAG: hypothetical protein ACK5QW_09720, partial [Cyanobacteriota bacterium]
MPATVPASDGSASDGSAPPAPSPRSRLLALLRQGGSRQEIGELIPQVEQAQPADLRRDAPLVEGVWELRWSSSSLPYLATAPWLANLQVLAPSRGQGRYLLRLAGPLGVLAGIVVRASIAFSTAVWGRPAWRPGPRRWGGAPCVAPMRPRPRHSL